MASQGLLGPLATVDATIGAKDRVIIAPSNTWDRQWTSVPRAGLNVPNQDHVRQSSMLATSASCVPITRPPPLPWLRPRPPPPPSSNVLLSTFRQVLSLFFSGGACSLAVPFPGVGSRRAEPQLVSIHGEYWGGGRGQVQPVTLGLGPDLPSGAPGWPLPHLRATPSVCSQLEADNTRELRWEWAAGLGAGPVLRAGLPVPSEKREKRSALHSAL